MEYITSVTLKSKIFEVYKNDEGYLEAYRSIGKEDEVRRTERIFVDSERIVSDTKNMKEFIDNFLKSKPRKKIVKPDNQINIFDVTPKEDEG